MSDLLKTIHAPEDVRSIPAEKLPELAEEIRSTILETVSHTGGHLASSLGAVELTIELLRHFTPPRDKIVWDVGHQAYTWKLLTGRADRFATLRQFGGLSGFPKREESACDAFIAGHAGNAISAALGMAVGRDRQKGTGQIVAVIGDAAMTNGISLEALNNLDDAKTKLILILNDNQMSIDGSVGSLSRRLGSMLANIRYNRIKAAAEAAGHKLKLTFLRGIYHRLEQAVKSLWLGNSFYEEFGLRYIGPIDGHNFRALNNAIQSAIEDKGPVIVHVVTKKGKGFAPAERDPTAWHGVGPFDLAKRELKTSGQIGYSKVFGNALTQLAERDPKIVAITAAMCSGTGLEPFATKFPERFFDVGICEEHAVVFAAGLATEGFRPFFAVYSSFLQRAVDCVMHDVCLQNLPVVFCIDRAGTVGADGPTHHGLFDIAMLRCLPNLTIMQPADPIELVALLKTALAQPGPCAIRYPRDPGPQLTLPPIEAIKPFPLGRAEVRGVWELENGTVVRKPAANPSIWIWALGDRVPLAETIASALAAAGHRTGVVNARFIKPLDRERLAQQAKDATRFVTLENAALAGGFGSALREALADLDCATPVESFGWPDRFVPQGTSIRLNEQAGLTAEAIVAQLLKHV